MEPFVAGNLERSIFDAYEYNSHAREIRNPNSRTVSIMRLDVYNLVS